MILHTNLDLTVFADFLSNFYDFLHFRRFPHFKNTILCKFTDKISKINKFYQRRKICFFSRHPSLKSRKIISPHPMYDIKILLTRHARRRLRQRLGKTHRQQRRAQISLPVRGMHCLRLVLCIGLGQDDKQIF